MMLSTLRLSALRHYKRLAGSEASRTLSNLIMRKDGANLWKRNSGG